MTKMNACPRLLIFHHQTPSTQHVEVGYMNFFLSIQIHPIPNLQGGVIFSDLSLPRAFICVLLIWPSSFLLWLMSYVDPQNHDIKMKLFTTYFSLTCNLLCKIMGSSVRNLCGMLNSGGAHQIKSLNHQTMATTDKFVRISELHKIDR